jgi:hypothetical protein
MVRYSDFSSKENEEKWEANPRVRQKELPLPVFKL